MITDQQIKDGLNKAYKEAGHNAYFGNGFEAGVRFALATQKTTNSSDYEVALKVYQEFDEYDEDAELIFSDWLHSRVSHGGGGLIK